MWSLASYSLTIPKRWYNCLISSEVVVLKTGCRRSLGWTASTAIGTLIGITNSRVMPKGFFSILLIDESQGPPYLKQHTLIALTTLFSALLSFIVLITTSWRVVFFGGGGIFLLFIVYLPKLSENRLLVWLAH